MALHAGLAPRLRGRRHGTAGEHERPGEGTEDGGGHSATLAFRARSPLWQGRIPILLGDDGMKMKDQLEKLDPKRNERFLAWLSEGG
jgi:hypothetical protein